MNAHPIVTRRRRHRSAGPVTTVASLIAFVLFSAGAVAQERPASEEADQPTIAVLDFVAEDPVHPNLGAELAEALAVLLSVESDWTIVDRASLERMLDEQALGITGMVDAESAARIGRLVGARILVTGKSFVLGSNRFVTVKFMSTETSLVEGVLVKIPRDADLAILVDRLHEDVVAKLRETAPQLAGPVDSPEDDLEALCQRLRDRELPTISVSIPETHVSPGRPAVDPAAETAVRIALGRCGLSVVTPSSDTELLVRGEAFSELGMRMGHLVSCVARVEVEVVDRKTGRVLLVDRVTARGVDLAEHAAAKLALDRAGQDIALGILEHLDEQGADR